MSINALIKSLLICTISLHASTLCAQTTPMQRVDALTNNAIFTLYGVEPDGSDQGSVLGSAVAVDKSLLATNCHVALSGTYLAIYVNHHRKNGDLYYYDKANDLCLIKIHNTAFLPAKIRSSASVKLGTSIYAIGNSINNEKIIAHGTTVNESQLKGALIIQTDTKLPPEADGGGLFDQNGNLIGITSANLTDSTTANNLYAIPTEYIQTDINLGDKQAIKPDAMNELATPNEVTTPIVKTASASPTTTPAAPIKYTTANLTQLSQFGGNNITLFKWDDDCILTINGTDVVKNTKSLAIWFPEEPGYLYIFPTITQLDDALKILDNYLSDESITLQNTYSYLLLGQRRFSLDGDSRIHDVFSMLIKEFDDNPTALLLNQPTFSVKVRDFKSHTDVNTFSYSLAGLSDGIAASQKVCKPKADDDDNSDDQ